MVTNPTTGQKLKLTGDTPPTDEDLDEIFSQSEIAQQKSAEVNRLKSTQPMMAAVAEPAAAILSGMAGSVVGGLAGIGAGGYELARQQVSGEPFNRDMAVDEAAAMSGRIQEATTYQPRTEYGKEGMAVVSDVMSSKYNPLTFGRQLNEYTGASDKLAESGYPGAATIVDVGADALAGYGVGKALQKGVQSVTAGQAARDANRLDLADRIISRTGDKDLAKLTIEHSRNGPLTPANAKIKNDKEASTTIKQGFDDGTVAAIKATSAINKRKLLEMVLIKERAKKNAVYGASNRPADIAGDSLAERVRHIKKVNKKAGDELDGVSQTLRGQSFDPSAPVNTLMSDLSSAGVRFDAAGKPKYKGSDFEGDGASQKILNLIVERSKNPRANDAYYAHRLKRFIDNKTTYGHTKAGATGDAERIIKNFRRNIDQKLDGSFPDYNRVNTQYSETIGALDAFKSAAGSKVDLFGENADKALGTVSRRLLSNTQSRVNMMDSIKNMEAVSKKYGADFKDDIMTQVMFVDELDKVFGASAKTSLLGDVEKGTRTALETVAGQRSLTGTGIEAAAKLTEKARGINEENAFKSIKDLLKRDDSHIQ